MISEEHHCFFTTFVRDLCHLFYDLGNFSSLERLRKFIEDHPYVNVLRFTTFFHQFTLVFDELAREKYVDWYGYSASVSPYILKQFEEEVGYPFRAEYIIDQGYYNNQYRVPIQ